MKRRDFLNGAAAMAAKMDKYIAEGLGGNDWTVIAKDNVPG